MRAIVFAIRGCPAGWLGAYGNEWVVTPHLDQFAAEGIAFDRHISDCPDPEAAGQAWLHGSRVLEQLQVADVRTVVLRANHTDTDTPASFYDGWGEVFDARPQEEDTSPLDHFIRSLPSVLDRLANVPRWLLWVEVDRCLPPWEVPQDVFDAYIEDLFEEEEPTPRVEVQEREADELATDDEDEDDEPEPIPVKRDPVPAWHNPTTGWFDVEDLPSWELLHRSFAAALTTFDADLGRLFTMFRDRGVDQSATWFITADRGYPLGEHGLIGYHRPWLHEELVHVPLIVRLPNAEEGGRRVTIFTQPADLMPTLLAAHGVASEATDGVNLLPHLRGETRDVRPFACSGFVQESASEWAIRTPEWAYLLPTSAHPDDDDPREPLLFEKPDDRWEVNDLRIRNLGHADDLEKLLRESC